MNIRRRLIHMRSVVSALLTAWLLVTAAQAGDYDRGLLWKIEAKDTAPSYLFGTLHSEDERVVRLPGPVQKAFDDSRLVILEMTMDPATLVNASLSMMLTDGRKLDGIVGDQLSRQAVTALADYGIPDLVVLQMKPWAVAVTLIMPKPVTGLVLDVVLYQQALAAGKGVEGLETLEEQLSVFDGLSEAHQVEMLRDTLDNLAQVRADYDAMLAAWLERDLAALVALGENSLQRAGPGLARQFNQTLIVDRNRRMVERLRKPLALGDGFIAVGALHLPGQEGLLHLLEQQGYRVTPVY